MGFSHFPVQESKRGEIIQKSSAKPFSLDPHSSRRFCQSVTYQLSVYSWYVRMHLVRAYEISLLCFAHYILSIVYCFWIFFFAKVFLHSRVIGACSVTTVPIWAMGPSENKNYSSAVCFALLQEQYYTLRILINVFMFFFFSVRHAPSLPPCLPANLKACVTLASSL